MKTFIHCYEDIISVENLFTAWKTFRRGKRARQDVQRFERRLEDNIFSLHEALADRSYRHGPYQAFYVDDPKQRHIHKAGVRDRLVHQILYSALYPIFDPTFISDTYSCRLGKGTHRAVARLRVFLRKVSKNNTRNCFVLKCDISKFFSSIDRDILIKLISRKVDDVDVIWLLSEVIDSFPKGMPLGNITSQIFANIYLNELDQFVKHRLRITHYIRYCDDFMVADADPHHLVKCIDVFRVFLWERLHVRLHEGKVTLRKFSWGVDFLGYLLLPHCTLVRTKTRRRLFTKVRQMVDEVNREERAVESLDRSIQSYLGLLYHTDSYNLAQRLKSELFIRLNVSNGPHSR